jgi:hypothetical protein
MFLLYDYLQVEIYATEINTTDNGSVVFKILVHLVDNGGRFLLTVNVATVGELTIACCWLSSCGLFWCSLCLQDTAEAR